MPNRIAAAFLHVRSADGKQNAVVKPGDAVPEWAVVSNPAALAGPAGGADAVPEPAGEDGAGEEEAKRAKSAKPAARSAAK